MENKSYTNLNGGGVGMINSAKGRIIFNTEDYNSLVMTTRVAATEILSKMSNSREEQEFDVSL